MAKNKVIPPVSVCGSAENQTAPVITSLVKKRPGDIEKQMGSSPLRRSERGKSPVGVPASNVKSTGVKSAGISKESAEHGNNEMQEVGGRKRKRLNAIRFKGYFKPQRVRVESDDEDDLENEHRASTSEAKTSSNREGDKEMVDRDKGVGNCSDEADGRSVQGSCDKAQKAVLEKGLKSSDQEEQIGCPSQTKPLEGESVGSGNVEKHIGDNCSPSNEHTAYSDNHVSHTSSSRINHVLENQQELDFRDKGTCETAGIMVDAENNIANTNIQNAGSIVNSTKFVEYWVPVQLSNVQLEQYCASLLSNAAVFQSCSKRATDEALSEILNSNRKCCNHPYLVDAKLQGKIIMDLKPASQLDVDIKVSGKLRFLDLVLPEVKKRQLRVLILYQHTSSSASVGPLLSEFVHQRFGENSYECLDGVGIVVSKKQTALSKFNNDKSKFIFLLVSNACNPSVKLSSIDLVIIFDSDLTPSTDIKSLQKISIDSQSEQIMVVRLYTSFTLEEKNLKLADHGNMIQNLRSKYDALLMWGAPDLFNRLAEFHCQSDINISSEESTLNNVVKEFLHIISRKSKSGDTAKSFITRVVICGSYGKNIMFHNEIKTLLPDGDQPHVFWKKLLEGQNPVWRFRSESTPRQRKRPNFFSHSSGVNTRRKTVKNVVEGETGRSNEGVPVQNESRLSSGDHFWSTAADNESSVGHEKVLHDLLKPKVSELCKKLKFSENVTTIVESFLKFVIENFQVFKEHTSTLQALMISVCWIGSSLSKYMMDIIDREESFVLAKKELNFICSKEEADKVYEKLQSVKEAFLQSTKDPQESEPENRNSSNEEILQSDEQIIKEDLARKDENEIDKFNRVWDKKRTKIENERKVEESLIRCLHPSKSSLRSEKLKSIEENFTKKLKEHERLRASSLSDLKAKLKAAVGQVVVNDEHSLHGFAHGSLIVDLVRSEKGDQGSPEVAPDLSGHPSEAQIRDKPLHGMCPVAVPAEVIILSDDDNSDAESVGSHSSEKQTADAMVKSEPIAGISVTEEIASSIPIEEKSSELQHEVDNDVVGSDAMVISELIGDIPAKHVADTGNDVAGADTRIVEGCNETGHNDSAAHFDSAEMEMLSVDNMSQIVESADGSHAVGNPNMSGPIDVAPHIESSESGIPSVECNKENADDGTVRVGSTSGGVEDHNVTSGSSSSSSSSSSADVAPTVSDHSVPAIHNEPLQVQQLLDSGIQDQEVQTKSNPIVQIEDSNLQPIDMGHVDQNVVFETPITDPVITENQSAIVPMSDVLAQTITEPMVAAETPTATHIQIQKAAPLEPDDVAPHEESADLRISAVECNKENADDGSTMSAATSHGVENLKDSSDSHGVAHVVSEDSVPVIQDIQNGPLQAQQFPDSGIQDEEVQVEPTPMIEIEDNNLQSIDMDHVDPVVSDDSSPNFHNQQLVAVETPVTEDQSATLPTVTEPVVPDDQQFTDSGVQDEEVQAEPTSIIEIEDNNLQSIDMEHVDPVVPDGPSPNSHNQPLLDVETPVTDPAVTEDQSGNLPTVTSPVVPDDPSHSSYNEPLVAAETPVTDPMVIEDQSATLPTREVLAQTTSGPINASETPITALTQIQNASQLERIFDIQRNGNFNQVGSRMSPIDPLHMELQRLRSGKETMVKMHQENMQKISVDCEREIAEVTAQIRLKYGNKRQEAETTFNLQYQEAESNMHKVAWNRVLAAAFRSKCKDLTPDHAGLQQAAQAGLMQQLHRISGPSFGSRSPGQSSGTQQSSIPPPSVIAAEAPPLSISAATAAAPISAAASPPLPAIPMPPPLPQRIQPPLQIVDNASALFSTPLARHPRTTNLRPTTTTPIRPQPNPNPIPSISSTTTTSIPAPIVTSITTSTTSSPIRLPHGSNHLSPSTTPVRPPFRLGSFDMSAANLRINTETRGQSTHSRPLGNTVSRGVPPHMRPMISREVRSPGPHLRPLTRSDIRSPAPHMRSFASTGVRFAAPHMRPFRPTSEASTFQPQVPGQHTKSGIPSTSTSQPPVSVSSVPLASLQPEPFSVPPPPPSTQSESQQPPPPRLSHTSHQHPQRSLNDNLNVLRDNVTRRMHAALTSEVVCLSDDE